MSRAAWALLLAAFAATAAPATSPLIPTVYFGCGETELNGPARTVLDDWLASVRTELANGSLGAFRIAGHSDRVGSDAANIRLSRRRAETVRDYLASRGISRDLMIIHACGERLPQVETEDETREPQNRRVDVTWGQPSTFLRSCEPGL